MLVQTSQGQSGSAHVVVLGNEKGGSGKSTTALHIAVALMKAGQRVAHHRSRLPAAELHPLHQQPQRLGAPRPVSRSNMPVHCCIRLGETMQIAENENSEFPAIHGCGLALSNGRSTFIVIDTPGTDSYLICASLHSDGRHAGYADHDSFLDFDVLGTVDPATYAVTGESHYAEMVRDTRRKRRQLDGATTDWIVVRQSPVDARFPHKQLRRRRD